MKGTFKCLPQILVPLIYILYKRELTLIVICHFYTHTLFNYCCNLLFILLGVEIVDAIIISYISDYFSNVFLHIIEIWHSDEFWLKKCFSHGNYVFLQIGEFSGWKNNFLHRVSLSICIGNYESSSIFFFGNCAFATMLELRIIINSSYECVVELMFDFDCIYKPIYKSYPNGGLN